MRILSVRRILPSGSSLPTESWNRRHQQIRLLLWAHVVGLPIFALAQGATFSHSLAEASLVAVLALVASHRGFSRTVQAGAATLGLVSSSAIITHLSGGMIEAHFHFFVMVVVVSLYQWWWPFLLALGFVVFHHGVIGVLNPAAVFDHAAAQANPWLWALVHGAFIAAQSVACLVTWRVNEDALGRERHARAALEHAHRDLVEAQALSGVGSWDWDLDTDRIWWSEVMHDITGVDRDRFVPSLAAFLDLVHPDDRARVSEEIQGALLPAGELDFECRIVRPDGDDRLLHSRGRLSARDDPVMHLIGTSQDITERKALEATIQHQALHDPLTGLGNRTLFLERTDHALALSKRRTTSIALLYLDLDDFKTINDSLGHNHGDQLLAAIADRLQETARNSDTVARFGGDEFAILLENVDLSGAVQAAVRIEAALAAPVLLDGRHCTIAASIGIAMSAPDINTADLLRNADLAMYAAKRDDLSYRVFSADMLSSVMNRMDLKAELASALTSDQFVVHYQPLGDLQTSELRGVEALVRWQHPARGLISPADFIPLAEETGMIIPLGAWVLNEACRETVMLHELYGQPFSISVNLSAVQLASDIVATVTEALSRSGLATQHLVLEITETAVMHQNSGALAKLAALRELGVRIAIDDFGTGYSSLGYLRELPVDILKIDRSFVNGLTDGGDQPNLVRSIVEMGQAHHLETIAEGIETAEQASMLRGFGCDLGQGFFLCRPKAPAELLGSLRSWPRRTAPPGAQVDTALERSSSSPPLPL